MSIWSEWNMMSVVSNLNGGIFNETVYSKV